MDGMERSCAQCAGPLLPTQATYCSRACFAAARTAWTIVPCEMCGTDLTLKPRYAGRWRFCAACRHERAGRLTSEGRPRRYGACVVCGGEFYQPRSQEARRYCSHRCAASIRIGKPSNRRLPETPNQFRQGFRLDIGHYCRSGWEANYARYLTFIGTAYQFEPQRFVLTRDDGTQTAYTPDFLIEHRTFVEVKGRWVAADREKVALFRAQQPDYTLVCVGAEQYRAIRQKYGRLIPHWESQGQLPPPAPTRVCPTCGNPVESIHARTVFCSQTCSAARFKKPKEVRACRACGVTFEVSPYESARWYCSVACADVRRSETNRVNRVGKRHTQATKDKISATKLAHRSAPV